MTTTLIDGNRQTPDERNLSLPGFTLAATGVAVDGQPTLKEWQALGEFLRQAEGAVQWWIGDWLNYGEGRPEWGDKYEQAIEMFGKDYHTLEKYKAVAKKYDVRNRLRNLSWTHHFALAYEPPGVRTKLLSAANPDSPGQKPKLSVSQLKKEAKRLRRERETPPLPDGQYRVILADPPWEYDDERAGTSAGGSAAAQYDLMPTDCICALRRDGREIRDLRANDSVLFLWATAPMFPDALQVIAAWGFKYRAQFVWDKKRQYVGSYNLVRHELLLIATCGSCTPAEGALHDTVIAIERTGHSEKPEHFYGLIEQMYPDCPRLELFSRNTRLA